MSKVSIINYLVHVNLFGLFIYLIPVLSLIALIKANSYFKKYLIVIDKSKKQAKKKLSLPNLINVLILVSLVGYVLKYELPQKEYFYKTTISKKQMKIDQENFLIGGN